MSTEDVAWVADVKDSASRAIAIAGEALDGQAPVEALVQYYSPAGGYAGALFTDLAPNDPIRITPTDLLAVTTLSVKVTPQSIRRIISTPGAGRLSELLGRLPTDVRIEDDDSAQYATAMAAMQETTKSLLGRNPWVTASKLCARKRPHLFPVRDSLVLRLLELKPDYARNWPVFAEIMRDREIAERLDLVIAEAAESGAHLGDPSLRLRHLDVALWMYASRSDR